MVASKGTGLGAPSGASASPSRAELSHAELVREARVAKALREVADALGASLELDELLEVVLSRASDLLGAERATLFLLDERQRELVTRASSPVDDYPLRIPLGEGMLSQVARTGRALRIDDFSEAGPIAEWDEQSGTQSRCAVAVPLKNNLGRTMGVLVALDSASRSPFRADDEEILSVLAKQAAVAVDNSRLLVTLIRKNQQLQQAQVQLTRRVRDLELLFDLERSTAGAQSHEQLARAVLESLARACSAEGAVLVLADQDVDAFLLFSLQRSRPTRSGGEEPEARFQSEAHSPSDSVLGPVIERSQPMQLDTATEPLELGSIHEVRSLIAEPLEGEGIPLGALALVNKRGGPFTAEDLGLLRLVSANVSTAVRLFNADQQRQRQERLSGIGRVLSQVVHDLKSPLTVISGYVQLMEEAEEQPDRSRYAAEILKQFEALGAMQQEVLAFARGETRVFSRRVIVDRFFEDLRERLRAELAGRGVELRLSAQKRLVAHFDSERMVRALQNLVRNAAEAMGPEGGVITIRAESDDEAVTFRVSDNGPGIPREIVPRLFQSFVTLGKKDGTGLGLAIVKRIVEEHGGTIELCPVPRGACFSIRIPQRQSDVSLGDEVSELTSGEHRETDKVPKSPAKDPDRKKLLANEPRAKKARAAKTVKRGRRKA